MNSELIVNLPIANSQLMKNITIKGNRYTVYFDQEGYQAINQFIASKNPSVIFILTDTNTHEYCLPHFLPQIEATAQIEILEIPAGEANKQIDICVQLWSALAELNCDRNSLLINLGGGVVTDTGGFVASTIKRGIDFIHVPTSLLAMVDAAVGGKNGVDLGPLKNQIGVINPPPVIAIVPDFLNTLSERELHSGMAEMLKHGLIASKPHWDALVNNSENDLELLKTLIYESVAIKNDIVLSDPFEKGERKKLNYGHTIGHALESYYLEDAQLPDLLHGEAVVIGMIMAGYLSQELTGFKHAAQLRKALLQRYAKIDLDKQIIPALLEIMKHDKKNVNGELRFVLLEDIGSSVVNIPVKEEMIADCFDFYSGI